MAEIILAIPILGLMCIGAAVLHNPVLFVRAVLYPEPDEEPEMPESLQRMTELADEAIAARAAGREPPRGIDEYRN